MAGPFLDIVKSFEPLTKFLTDARRVPRDDQKSNLPAAAETRSASSQRAATMTPNRLVALCEQNAHIHREVLRLIEAGELKIFLRGEDVTDVERVRIRNNLGRELEIIEAFADHCE